MFASCYSAPPDFSPAKYFFCLQVLFKEPGHHTLQSPSELVPWFTLSWILNFCCPRQWFLHMWILWIPLYKPSVISPSFLSPNVTGFFSYWRPEAYCKIIFICIIYVGFCPSSWQKPLKLLWKGVLGESSVLMFGLWYQFLTESPWDPCFLSYRSIWQNS